MKRPERHRRAPGAVFTAVAFETKARENRLLPLPSEKRPYRRVVVLKPCPRRASPTTPTSGSRSRARRSGRRLDLRHGKQDRPGARGRQWQRNGKPPLTPQVKKVLSARAEVFRQREEPIGSVYGALRASGGVPIFQRAISLPRPCSPRERRCSGPGEAVLRPRQVLSARAEVFQETSWDFREMNSALRASGGVPLTDAGWIVGEWCSPRERRCSARGAYGPAAAAVLSARAEVFRPPGSPGRLRAGALRASGGVPMWT